MLPLIGVSEREDLVISIDTALKLSAEDREPVRAIPKRECQLSDHKPSVFKVRPLRSREMVRVMNALSISSTEGLVRAAELGICEMMNLVTKSGEVKFAKTPQEVDQLIDECPHAAVLAVGGWIIEQSTAPPDPTEPDE